MMCCIQEVIMTQEQLLDIHFPELVAKTNSGIVQVMLNSFSVPFIWKHLDNFLALYKSKNFWYYFSIHPQLSMSDLEKFPKENFDENTRNFCRNSTKITQADVEKLKDRFRENFFANENFSLEYLVPTNEREFTSIAYNSRLAEQFFSPETLSNIPDAGKTWILNRLAYNYGVSATFFEKYYDTHFSFMRSITHNFYRGCSRKFILTHSSKFCIPSVLADNNKLTVKDIASLGIDRGNVSFAVENSFIPLGQLYQEFPQFHDVISEEAVKRKNLPLHKVKLLLAKNSFSENANILQYNRVLTSSFLLENFSYFFGPDVDNSLFLLSLENLENNCRIITEKLVLELILEFNRRPELNLCDSFIVFSQKCPLLSLKFVSETLFPFMQSHAQGTIYAEHIIRDGLLFSYNMTPQYVHENWDIFSSCDASSFITNKIFLRLQYQKLQEKEAQIYKIISEKSSDFLTSQTCAIIHDRILSQI